MALDHSDPPMKSQSSFLLPVLLLSLGFAAGACLAAPGPDDARVHSLAGPWKFQLDPKNEGEKDRSASSIA